MVAGFTFASIRVCGMREAIWRDSGGATGSGTVDLPLRQVDYRLTPSVAGIVAVPVIITGPWDDLSYRPDVSGMAKDLAKDPGKALDTLKGGGSGQKGRCGHQEDRDHRLDEGFAGRDQTDQHAPKEPNRNRDAHTSGTFEVEGRHDHGQAHHQGSSDDRHDRDRDTEPEQAKALLLVTTFELLLPRQRTLQVLNPPLAGADPPVRRSGANPCRQPKLG